MKIKRLSTWMLPLAAGLTGLLAQTAPLEIHKLTPPAGIGYSATFRMTVSDGGDAGSIARAGIYITNDFDGRVPAKACAAYWDRNADAFFLADNTGTVWRRTTASAGAPVENSQCRIIPSESRVTADGGMLTVELAVRFTQGFEGSKLVYGYANAFGDTRSTGWKEAGSWLVGPEAPRPSAAVLAASVATTDPNDLPTAEVNRPDTAYQAFLRANPGAVELTHQQGQLRFQTANKRKAVVAGAVTHRDNSTGAWVPNAPALSLTNNGWRVDGTQNSLLIKKQGISQHVVTQTYTDYATKHPSTLTLTLPSLVYDSKSGFHFAQDGLTWQFIALQTGAVEMLATVGARRGAKTYSFDVSSSETLRIDTAGNLVGDTHVNLTRAVMVPKFGRSVPCSAWTYSAKSGASFTCDDSGFKDNQLPYRIDPSSTLTDGDTHSINAWRDNGDGSGSEEATVDFNTSGIAPAGVISINTSCGFDVTQSNLASGDWVGCRAESLNNAGITHVTVYIGGDSICCSGNTYDSADVDNISLTVSWVDQVTVSVSPASTGLTASQTQQFTASVSGTFNTGVTWSISPSVGSINSSGLYTAPSSIPSAQNVTVTATSVADGTKSASATVGLAASVAVSVSPGSATLVVNGTQQFTATVTGASNTAVTWTRSPALGSVSSSGLYTAPSSIASQATVTVTATSVADGTKSASASVTLIPVSVSVSAARPTMTPELTNQLTATVTNAGGNNGVTWSMVSGAGAVSAYGVYTSPIYVSGTQTATIRATSAADPAQSGTVQVTVVPWTVSGAQGRYLRVQLSGTNNLSLAEVQVTSAGVNVAQGKSASESSDAYGSVPGRAVDGNTDGSWWNNSVTHTNADTNAWWQVDLGASYAVSTISLWNRTDCCGDRLGDYWVFLSDTPFAQGETPATLQSRAGTWSNHQTTAPSPSTALSTVNSGAPYQYFVADLMTSINANYWQLNGGAAASSGGLTANSAGGSAISRVAVWDGSSDYEVQATVHLPNPVAWGTVFGVMARATGDGASGYSFTMSNAAWDSAGCTSLLTVTRSAPGNSGVLAQLPYGCHDGMKLRMVVRGSTIQVGVDAAWSMTLTDTVLSTGKPGVYILPASGATISNVQIGAIDSVAPSAVSAASVASSASPYRVDLQWTAASDDTAGSGVAGYIVWRDGTQLGITPTASFTDDTVRPTTGNTTYAFAAFDWHGNTSSQVTKVVSVPSGPPDPRRIGVRPSGSYWGAAGEQIDLLSGNLNFSLPVASAKSRGGWSANFMLSYNSQMWRKDGNVVWNVGKDVGYGLGWRLQAGSVYPVYFGSTLQAVIFTDATGAEYRMEDIGGWVFRAKEGLHLWMEWGTGILHFPDGGTWTMGNGTAASEQDAGTRYPTQMMDTNGNTITLGYQAGVGGAGTSARLTGIGSPAGSFGFGYNADTLPHLTGFSGPNLNDTVQYSRIALVEPFGGTAFGAASVLASLSTWEGATQTFSYNPSAEMLQTVSTLGGTLGWGYRTYTYTGNGRTYREVQSRTLSTGNFTGAVNNTWNLTTDSGASQHATWTVSDVGANSSKVWTFGTSGVSQGLAVSYEERGPGGTAVNHTDYTWAADPIGIEYIQSVVNILDPATMQVQSKSTQTLDQYGNITQSQVYDFGNPPTLAKTYDYTYLNDANYTSRYIFNRVATVSVTPAGGTATTLVSNTYDSYMAGCAGVAGLTLRQPVGPPSSWQHDDANFGTSFTYRGNVTYRSSIGGTSCTGYETTGVAVRAEDGAGHILTSAPSADTSYSLPGVLTPGGNANLATTVSYSSSWQVTSVTGANGAQGTTTYDGPGRPQKTKIPDGAETNYTYTYVPNTQTATLGTRFKKTTLDGFGRVIRVETGHDSTTVSQVDTQYAACACSPLGKLWRTSAPYAPGGTPVWTTYAYDGSGRTVSVTAPDGSVTTTQYLTVYGGVYGNFVKVTDPAGKWKIQRTDAMGNLWKVYEPNPAGGADLVTSYSYNVLGQMTDVAMTRSTGTQTRHFVYTGTDLTSATNPENGTVTYVYDASHRVTKRTDAKGQETRYTYDGVGRLTQVQHGTLIPNAPSPPIFNEFMPQRVNYYYDGNPLDGSYSQNVAGRLGAVTFQDANSGSPFTYQYSYNQAGRVTTQRMQADYGAQVFDAGYSWDNEGRMTGTNYGPAYTMQYDANGRLSGLQDGGTTVASASYDTGTGLMTGLSYFGFGETRQYNSLMQMTRQTVASSGTNVMDMQYNFTAGANNGRIASSVDNIIGETVTYGYDSLNRLTSAAAGTAWGQAYEYDGFGNLTRKTAAGAYPEMNVSFDAATNRGPGNYDANGNLLTGTYDVENRLIADSAMTYAYDHAGKRVAKHWQNGDVEYYFYGIGGQKLVTHATVTVCGTTCNSQTTRSYNVYFGGKLVKSKGVVVATDRLGSVRANSNGESFQYFPYGEERTTTADNREKFGTYTRDSATQDYADQRYYGVGMGRFGTPDPSGMGVHGSDLQETVNDIIREVVGLNDSQQADMSFGTVRAAFLPTLPGQAVLPGSGSPVGSDRSDSSAEADEPSPSGISATGAAHLELPTSWNRYVYVDDDPVNDADPDGLSGVMKFFCGSSAKKLVLGGMVWGALRGGVAGAVGGPLGMIGGGILGASVGALGNGLIASGCTVGGYYKAGGA